MLTFDFELFVQFMATQNTNSFPKFTVNLKQKQFLQLANSDVTSFISDNFPDRSTIMKAKKTMI